MKALSLSISNFNGLVVAGLLASSALWGQVVLAQNEQQAEAFFTKPPVGSNFDKRLDEAIEATGALATAARVTKSSPSQIKALLTGGHQGQEFKYFYVAKVGSITNPQKAGHFQKNDEIVIGITKKQANSLIHRQGEYIAMGMTEQQALAQSDRGLIYPPDRACDDTHNDGDIANRWCHAAITEAFTRYFLERGVNPIGAAIIGALPIVLKEYLVDDHPSKSDIVIGEIELLRFNANKPEKKGSISATAFLDGAVFLTYRGKFRGL